MPSSLRQFDEFLSKSLDKNELELAKNQVPFSLVIMCTFCRCAT